MSINSKKNRNKKINDKKNRAKEKEKKFSLKSGKLISTADGQVVKYLYLTKIEHVDTWVNGGDIPIALASTYLSDTRSGIMTPDENLIHESPIPIPSLKNIGIRIENVRSLTMTNCRGNGMKIPNMKNAHYYKQDGLILSFCNSFNNEVAYKLDKKACVKVNDIKALCGVIDKQLGRKGVMRSCQYTHSHKRNHFLKHVDDSWQDEFRLFWLIKENKSVTLPSGVCEFVSEF
ncbi:conserved hypothetical protein [Psychromonas ingrahamii 37]|uniref:Uncharacterized protein n=1 Tax=Psychromonas ingrahamii (strain DSM 17664 / CCUG 51855 / 37) TaxID=357804 RepID=A1T035_PSYIN|nr:hypothetical protein [Psychromonas ingrahamii]ABM05100.1 conserved hypothetical protein [Psychromonas ingrahamii 37]